MLNLFDLLEITLLWGLYVGLPVMLILYNFGAKKTAFWLGLIFAGYNLIRLQMSQAFL